VLVHKRGAQGSRVYLARPGDGLERIDAPGFRVEVYNILGAGDAFAAGILYGYVNEWDWYKTARLAMPAVRLLSPNMAAPISCRPLTRSRQFVQQQGDF